MDWIFPLFPSTLAMNTLFWHLEEVTILVIFHEKTVNLMKSSFIEGNWFSWICLRSLCSKWDSYFYVAIYAIFGGAPSTAATNSILDTLSKPLAWKKVPGKSNVVMFNWRFVRLLCHVVGYNIIFCQTLLLTSSANRVRLLSQWPTILMGLTTFLFGGLLITQIDQMVKLFIFFFLQYCDLSSRNRIDIEEYQLLLS